MKKKKKLSEEQLKEVKALYLKAGGTGLSLLGREEDNLSSDVAAEPSQPDPQDERRENAKDSNSQP